MKTTKTIIDGTDSVSKFDFFQPMIRIHEFARQYLLGGKLKKEGAISINRTYQPRFESHV